MMEFFNELFDDPIDKFFAILFVVAILLIIIYILLNRNGMSEYYKRDKKCTVGKRVCENGDCRKCTFAYAKFSEELISHRRASYNNSNSTATVENTNDDLEHD